MLKRIVLAATMLSSVFLGCAAKDEVAEDPAELTVALTLRWQDQQGRTEEQSFPPIEVSAISGAGLWVTLREDGGRIYPGVAVNGEFLPLRVALEDIGGLELELGILEAGVEKLRAGAVLFSLDRVVGTRMAAPENVYHLLVLQDFVDSSRLPSELAGALVPEDGWQEPFFRTHRLAMNYAAQSDAQTRAIAKSLGVEASYRLPRLILVAEEILAVNVMSGGGQEEAGDQGLLGFDLASKMKGEDEAEEQTLEERRFPTYSLDVLHDEILASGKYSAGFQNARSLWNDILEGKVIYEASQGTRRVISATIVFSQMQKNIELGRSSNRVLLIDPETTDELESCEGLWPSVKKNISTFLADNADWRVLIPQRPVTFYDGDQRMYDMYAWYRIHPETGRLIGVLPNNMRGALSDEGQKFEEAMTEKGTEAATKVAGSSAVLAFGQQIAGMYVAAGGVIEGVSMTFCDPRIAEMGQQEWLKFLSIHALDFSSKFLQEHADFYDNYAVMLSFWQGAVTMAGLVGGGDAIREGFNRAIQGVVDKATEDAKKWAEEKLEKLKEGVLEELGDRASDYLPSLEDLEGIADEAADEYMREVKEWIEAMEQASEITGEVVDAAETWQEAYERYDAVREEILEGLKERSG